MYVVLLDEQRAVVSRSSRINARGRNEFVVTQHLVRDAAAVGKVFHFIRIERGNGQVQVAEIQLLSDPSCRVARKLNGDELSHAEHSRQRVRRILTTVTRRCGRVLPLVVNAAESWPLCVDAAGTDVPRSVLLVGDDAPLRQVSEALRRQLPAAAVEHRTHQAEQVLAATSGIVFVDARDAAGWGTLASLCNSEVLVGQLYVTLLLASPGEPTATERERIVECVTKRYRVHGYAMAPAVSPSADSTGAAEAWQISLSSV